MAFVQNPPVSNKDVEFTNLGTHVVLCQERYRVLEDRVIRAEVEINDIHAQSKSNRKAMLSAFVAVVTGIVSGTIVFFIKGGHF